MNNQNPQNSDLSGNENPFIAYHNQLFFENDKNKSKKSASIGKIILFIFLYIIIAMLIPSCILFFITRWSAKSALKTTICGNPELLKNLFGQTEIIEKGI